MNGSPRFAGHRSGLEFCKDLIGSIDQHLGILELETGIDIEHGLEKTGDRVSAPVLCRKSEGRKIRQLKSAILRKHLRRLLRISEREVGVVFSCERGSNGTRTPALMALYISMYMAAPFGGTPNCVNACCTWSYWNCS